MTQVGYKGEAKGERILQNPQNWELGMRQDRCSLGKMPFSGDRQDAKRTLHRCWWGGSLSMHLQTSASSSVGTIWPRDATLEERLLGNSPGDEERFMYKEIQIRENECPLIPNQ